MNCRTIALFAGLLLASAGLASTASAQTASGTAYVFTTVDEVAAQGNYVYVTGILQGDSTPSTKWIQFYSSTSSGPGYSTAMDGSVLASSCERKALLAMSKPGQYLLKIQGNSSSAVPVCALIKVNP